jgi:hypothetical protein
LVRIVLRIDLMAGCALSLALLAATPAGAQDLQSRAVAPPAQDAPVANAAPPAIGDDQVQFSATGLEYDTDADVVTATGEVRMFRQGDRLRADKVVWNRKTGKVVATGNIAVTNPEGDIAYGDEINLTDSLKDGVIDNMLVVLEQGGRLAAKQGTRDLDGTVELRTAGSIAHLLFRRAPASVRAAEPAAAGVLEPRGRGQRQRAAVAQFQLQPRERARIRATLLFQARPQQGAGDHAACLHQRAADAAGGLFGAEHARGVPRHRLWHRKPAQR